MTRRNDNPARSAPASPWRPPTRRAFFSMLGAAAAALAVRPALAPDLDADQSGERRRGSKTIWIGHC